MKRPRPLASLFPGGIADEAARAPTSLRGYWRIAELDEIEPLVPDGNDVGAQIVNIFETRGIRFSEATLRKYVQLWLVPRSVRVGRKGRHRGSCGALPVLHVIRRVTIIEAGWIGPKQSRRSSNSCAHFKDDIESVEKAPARAARRLRARGEGARRGRRRAPRGWSARSPRRNAPPASVVRRIASLERTDFCPRRTCIRLNGRRRERPLLTVAERPTEEECHG